MQEKNTRLSSFRMRGALLFRKRKQKAGTAMTSARQTKDDYVPINVIGKGAFGVVYCARSKKGEIVAIKKVLIDPHFKNRELEIIKSIRHPNCIILIDSFDSPGGRKSEHFLNIVMDFFPQTWHDFNIQYRNRRLYPPILFVKLFAYQMLSGLSYLHSKNIVHRDVKPQNLLVNPETGVLKICDFGSAKVIKPDEKSVSYIASRYYRAPELVLDCQQYTAAIDMWSAGCVIAEAINAGQPMFSSDTSRGMIDAMIKVIGKPTDDDLSSFMQEHEYVPSNVEQSTTIAQSLPQHAPGDLIDLLSKIFVFNPGKRLTAAEAMEHPCFQELFKADLILPSGSKFPILERARDKMQQTKSAALFPSSKPKAQKNVL